MLPILILSSIKTESSGKSCRVRLLLIIFSVAPLCTDSIESLSLEAKSKKFLFILSRLLFFYSSCFSKSSILAFLISFFFGRTMEVHLAHLLSLDCDSISFYGVPLFGVSFSPSSFGFLILKELNLMFLGKMLPLLVRLLFFSAA